MRKNTQSADDADAAEESFDGVRIEPIGPEEGARSGANGGTLAPGWTKRLSTRGKLARALVAALAVIVALIAFLPHATFTLPPQITRLLTPVPTHTPTPGRFSAGQLEQFLLPAVPGAMNDYVTPSPRDPETAYICLSPIQSDPGTGETNGAISLWITHDVGQTWSRAALPGVTGVYCNVDSALDGSPRVTVNVMNALDQNAQPCAHSQYFLSEDDGATWRAIQHTTLAPATGVSGNCYLWATARHLFMSTYLARTGDQNGSSQEQSFLERSDDGGRTWLRADHSLEGVNIGGFAQPLDATGEALFAFVTTYSSGILTQSDLWMTHDAGASWRRVGPAQLPAPTKGGRPLSNILTEARMPGGPQACHCVFGVSYPEGYAPDIIGEHLYLSRDLTHWTLLPPIPVKGTSALRSGVYQTLGMTADGRLLALGPDPLEGVPAFPDQNGQVSGPPPALWAWNTHTGRWEVASTHVPCEDLQSCYPYATGVSVAMGASGTPAGTYFWVSVQAGSNQNGPPSRAFYRLYIPAA
jgi:hypothetical protein